MEAGEPEGEAPPPWEQRADGLRSLCPPAPPLGHILSEMTPGLTPGGLEGLTSLVGPGHGAGCQTRPWTGCGAAEAEWRPARAGWLDASWSGRRVTDSVWLPGRGQRTAAVKPGTRTEATLRAEVEEGVVAQGSSPQVSTCQFLFLGALVGI